MVCPCEYEIVKSETALCESDNNGQKSYIQIKSEIMGVNSEKTHIYMYPGKVLACSKFRYYTDRVKRIWYLSPMRAAKVQASMRIRAVSPELPLLAHTSSESRGIFRQKSRSLAPLNGWACAVKICHDGMLEDTNSLDGAHTI